MSAANWTAIENALQAWVKAGAPPAIWAAQSAPRPPLPFATLKHDGGGSKGLPETSLVYNGSAPAGQEIELNTKETSEFTVTVNVFTADTSGDGFAVAVLSRLRAALLKDSQTAAFQAAGCAVIDRGTVHNLTDLLETKFEGRASLDVRFRAADGTQDTTGYIETVGPISSTVTT